MREEAVTAAEGWIKTVMDKMHKVDGFIKESQRLTTGAGELSQVFNVTGCWLITTTSTSRSSTQDSEGLHVLEWRGCSSRDTYRNLQLSHPHRGDKSIDLLPFHQASWKYIQHFSLYLALNRQINQILDNSKALDSLNYK